MAASIIIEQESGTFTRPIHRHNGYYAGDFSRRDTGESTVPNFHPVAPTPARPFLDRPRKR